MKAIMLFASGSSKDGKRFSTNREKKFIEKVRTLKGDYRILIDREVIGYDPHSIYSKLLTAGLLKAGLSRENIVVLPVFVKSTAGELAGAEAYLKMHPEVEKIYAASSWYHLPRIWLMWYFQSKRVVKLYPIYSTEMIGVLIEPLKYPLIFLSPYWQEKCGKLLEEILRRKRNL